MERAVFSTHRQFLVGGFASRQLEFTTGVICQKTGPLKQQENKLRLRNGPDKNDSNNSNEHVGMQEGANFFFCLYLFLIGSNSKS